MKKERSYNFVKPLHANTVPNPTPMHVKAKKKRIKGAKRERKKEKKRLKPCSSFPKCLVIILFAAGKARKAVAINKVAMDISSKLFIHAIRQ